MHKSQPDTPLANWPNQKSNLGTYGRVFHYGRIGGTHPPPAKTLTNPLMFPQVPSHYFARKMLILLFSCSFWLFWPKVSQTVDVRRKTLCGCMSRMLMPTLNAAF